MRFFNLILTLLCGAFIGFSNTASTDIYYLETLHKEEVKIILNDPSFKLLEEPSIFNNDPSIYCWIKINQSNLFNSRNYLVLYNSVNNFETIYLTYKDSVIQQINVGTDQYYESETYLPSLLLSKKADQLLIQIRSNTFLFEDFSIMDKEEMTKVNYYHIMLYTGALIAQFFLGIFLFTFYLKVRKKIILSYLFFLAAVMLTTFFISNFGRYFIWKEIPFSNSFVESGVICLMVVTYHLFIIEATYLRLHSKKLLIATKAFIFGFPLLYLTAIILRSPLLASKLASIVPPLSSVLIAIVIIRNVRLKHNNAKYIALGFSFFILSISIRILMNFGVLKITLFNEALVFGLMLVELIVFSYVVIFHIEKKQVNSSDIEQLNKSFLQIQTLKDRIKKLENAAKHEPIATVESSINDALVTPLSKREIEVLNALIKGLKYQKIADELHISVNTLKTHVNRIYNKLETKNKVETINKIRKLT